MRQLENIGINKEVSEKEKSAENFKTKFNFLMVQISDVANRLEKGLETNYENLEKQTSQKELEEKIKKEKDMIEFLSGVIKDAFLELKTGRLKKINKKYMDVLEFSKLGEAEKETARQDYLHSLGKLVSDEDFDITKEKILKGDLNSLYRQFEKLKSSERVVEETPNHAIGRTQEEAIDNIKTISRLSISKPVFKAKSKRDDGLQYSGTKRGSVRPEKRSPQTSISISLLLSLSFNER